MWMGLVGWDYTNHVHCRIGLAFSLAFFLLHVLLISGFETCLIQWTNKICDVINRLINQFITNLKIVVIDIKIQLNPIAFVGRLGNNMCQYATLLALARLNGYVPYQQELMKNELKKYFNQSMRVVSNEVHKKINWNWELLHDWMSAEYSIFHCNFTLVHGFPCSWTFYHHIRDDIKREFQFHREIIRDVEKHLGSLSKSAKTTFIGVHVRREDYVTLMKDTYEGVLANSEFFTQAMNYYRGKFKDCLFIVCSDDLNWCKKNIDNSLGDVHFCWGGNTSSPGRDMALLTQCNHSIITVGTFSFWSAYLTGGEVVYLNNYVSRLGNNMGQYATLLALARINGFAPYQQEVLKEQLSKYFNPSMPVITKEVYKQVNWSILPLHNWMSHEYFQLDCNFTLMYGYPNSWTFFHHIRDEIKREFQFRSEIIRAAQEQLGSLKKSDNTTFIGVHVRRTDYVVLMYYLYNGVLANSEFFTQAMNYFRRKFKNCLFIVCSDDLKWCKKNIDNSLGDVHFCWNGNSTTPGRDMALLTQCNHSIITVGTFGFWSAYLTGGEVVYLNNYLRNSSILRKNFYFNATYRSEWIPIDADVNCTM
uniref:L-Fucosyltransferase n=1 Tax=Strigamia maritima TaxID=126957 RepID=T1JBK5_STRMM